MKMYFKRLNKMETKQIETIEELNKHWEDCYIVGVRKSNITKKYLVEGFNLGCKVLRPMKFERHITKGVTFKTGLKEPINMQIHIDQEKETYWIEINGCQETAIMEGIPNWKEKGVSE